MSYISDDTLFYLSSFFFFFQHLKAQLDKEQSTLHPVTEMTKDLLKNITDILSILKEVKKVRSGFL